MAINRQQYAKVSTSRSTLPVSNGLFVPGVAVLLADSYPLQPRQGGQAGQAGRRSHGGPDHVLHGARPTTPRPSGRAVPSAGGVGRRSASRSRLDHRGEQNDLINNALAGSFQALLWRQFGAVDPDLNYIFWSTTTISSGRCPSTWPATPTRSSRRRSWPGGPARRRRGAGRGLPDGQQAAGPRPALPVDDRAVWAVIGDPTRCRTSTTRPPRTGQGLRHDRRLHLADPDLDQLSVRAMSGSHTGRRGRRADQFVHAPGARGRGLRGRRTSPAARRHSTCSPRPPTSR
jgi:hypothetical protein